MSGIRIYTSLPEQWTLSLLAHLSNGDIILAPVEGAWCLCLALGSDKMDRINLAPDHFKGSAILLVDSIEAMKQFVDIHPRIETLLSYHRKPLNLFFHDFRLISNNFPVTQSRLIIRKNCDPFWEKLLIELGKPIVIFPQKWVDDHWAEWNRLPPDVWTVADFWIPEFHPELPKKIPGAFINKSGDLEFMDD